MMEKNIVTIEFEALPENQSFARSVAAAYVGAADPTVEELTEIKTAVSEAVSNAIIHGYERKGQGRISMEMKFVDRDKVFIRITDQGCGIDDIARAREPMYSTGSDMEMSGMGFTVMESFVDKVLVESQLGVGTSVTLIKYLDTYYDL
ncbi:anti-sigma F factor [Ihubacter sp. rT4E-8]|uniref:anti-sigma F factor n=1 Tax=Ihubacter sp. rT4E-8 TaxID=3242369 RepID=UPI003CE76D79